MTITEISNSFHGFVSNAPAEFKLSGFHLVAQDSHAINALKDKKNIQLVVVMPHTDYEGSPDSPIETRTIILFFIEKDITGQKPADELKQYQKTEDILKDFINFISEKQSEGCSLWNNYNPSSVLIHPEYRIFGGWNGWSLTFSF